MCTTYVFIYKWDSIDSAFYTDQNTFIWQCNEHQTVQRIKPDPDLHFLLTVIYK